MGARPPDPRPPASIQRRRREGGDFVTTSPTGLAGGLGQAGWSIGAGPGWRPSWGSGGGPVTSSRVGRDRAQFVGPPRVRPDDAGDSRHHPYTSVPRACGRKSTNWSGFQIRPCERREGAGQARRDRWRAFRGRRIYLCWQASICLSVVPHRPRPARHPRYRSRQTDQGGHRTTYLVKMAGPSFGGGDGAASGGVA